MFPLPFLKFVFDFIGLTRVGIDQISNLLQWIMAFDAFRKNRLQEGCIHFVRQNLPEECNFSRKEFCTNHP